jgi:ribonucleoside-diphosphate reductase alpha chain
VLEPDGSRREELVEDYAVRLYRAKFGRDAALPDYFVTAQTLTPIEHVRMQAALQRHVDSAISKTVNVPEDISFEAFQEVYREAYRSGCKGCTTYRPNAITGSVLSTTSAPAAPAVTTAPQPTHEPLPRPGKLTGSTYKLRWVDSAHALYITINDLEEDGRRRPFEVFISSANMEHFSWVVALTRMISAVFRRGGEVGFVADELKGIFDPRGGQWSDGRYVPSLIAAIGGIIEQHMIETGFIAAQDPSSAPVAPAATSAGGLGLLCPKCSQRGVVKEGACLTCHHCGWSKCG